jgi:hypothetical protein
MVELAWPVFRRDGGWPVRRCGKGRQGRPVRPGSGNAPAEHFQTRALWQ